jgi:hypothetical protein
VRDQIAWRAVGEDLAPLAKHQHPVVMIGIPTMAMRLAVAARIMTIQRGRESGKATTVVDPTPTPALRRVRNRRRQAVRCRIRRTHDFSHDEFVSPIPLRKMAPKCKARNTNTGQHI